MGPQSYDCGNESVFLRALAKQIASMGPQSYDCGNVVSTGGTRSLTSSFNGAAVVRLRKSTAPSKQRTANSLLQWGRSRTTAEIRPPTRASRPNASFNGAAVVRLRKCGIKQQIDNLTNRASMGPQSYDCGNDRIDLALDKALAASMGPQSYDCGNVLLLGAVGIR